MKKVNNASYDRKKYTAGASKIKMILWYFKNILFFINPLNPISSLKILLLKIFGAKIGKGVVVKPSVNIKFPWKLEIGDYAWIGENVWIDNLEYVKIGANVCISQGALLLTGSHDATRSTFDYMGGNIKIDDGVWIGAKAVVTAGVNCGSHSILGANSIAENDLEPYAIYKVNPAIPVIERNVFQ